MMDPHEEMMCSIASKIISARQHVDMLESVIEEKKDQIETCHEEIKAWDDYRKMIERNHAQKEKN